MDFLVNIAILSFGVVGSLAAVGGDTWHSKEQGIRRVTKRGWVALACLVATFGFGVVKEVRSQAAANKLTTDLTATRNELQKIRNESRARGDTIEVALRALLTAAQGRGTNAPTFVAALERLGEIPAVVELKAERPNVASLFGELGSRIGGRKSTIKRLRALDPSIQWTKQNILHVASVSLKSFDIGENSTQTEAVLGILRGLEADILFVQEIKNLATLHVLASKLPSMGVVGQPSPRHHGYNLAIFYNVHRVRVLGPLVIPGPFAREPLGQTVEVDDLRFDIVDVHLKSPVGGKKSLIRRKKEILAVKEWL